MVDGTWLLHPNKFPEVRDSGYMWLTSVHESTIFNHTCSQHSYCLFAVHHVDEAWYVLAETCLARWVTLFNIYREMWFSE